MKIVCIGGGYGLFYMFSVIRFYCVELIVIVVIIDNGGSIGKLRNS